MHNNNFYQIVPLSAQWPTSVCALNLTSSEFRTNNSVSTERPAQDHMDAPTHEMQLAVIGLRSNKTAGPDSIPA